MKKDRDEGGFVIPGVGWARFLHGGRVAYFWVIVLVVFTVVVGKVERIASGAEQVA